MKAASPLASLCHIVASAVLILAASPCAHALIYAFSDNNVTDRQAFEDLPAQFGAPLPMDGMRGYIIQSEPENACEPIMAPPTRDNSTIFIALIRRFDCNFDIKVLHAQQSGFDAAIVHNVASDQILNMAWNDERIRNEISIPSVFIGATAGRVLLDKYSYYENAYVLLFPEFNLNFAYYLIPFIVVVAVIIVVMSVVMVVRCVQHRKRMRRNRLSKDQLKKIPIHKFKKGDPYEVCAICLEEYEEGDKLRVLPCSHAYHSGCVDPWLTKTKKSCPVCKHRVLRSEEDSDSEGGGEEAGRGDESDNERDNERTPLLRPSPSFGSMAESPPTQQGEPESSTTAVTV